MTQPVRNGRAIPGICISARNKKRAIMHFVVYLSILMVAISTFLLEVHWLASPPDPQPKPVIQAGPPPAPKTEGPNAVRGKKRDASRNLLMSARVGILSPFLMGQHRAGGSGPRGYCFQSELPVLGSSCLRGSQCIWLGCLLRHRASLAQTERKPNLAKQCQPLTCTLPFF
jgi:hypothetical protein